MRRRAAVAIPWACVLLAAACASTPPSRFYTLTAITSPGVPPSDLSVAVGPVSVPAAVDRPQIVVSTSANEVRLDEFNRWASPLQNDIARVVAESLVAMLGTPRVALSPQTLSREADYRVVIEVQRFESMPGEAATLDAVWTVSRAKGGASQTGRTAVREPVPDKSFDALAAAHSRAVARLSRDIADAVRGLDGAGRRRARAAGPEASPARSGTPSGWERPGRRRPRSWSHSSTRPLDVCPP
jgi:uncharacterized lipoprotein YmbA